MNIDDLTELSDELLPRMLADRAELNAGLASIDVEPIGPSSWGHLVLFDLDRSGAVRKLGLGVKVAVVDAYRQILTEALAARRAQYATAGSRDEIYAYFETEEEMDGIVVADEIRRMVQGHAFRTEAGVFRLTVSAGVYSSQNPMSIDQMAARSREALSEAKKTRNAVASTHAPQLEVQLRVPRDWMPIACLQRQVHRGLWIWDESTGPIRYWTTVREFGLKGFPPADLRERLSTVQVADVDLEMFARRVVAEMAWARGEQPIPDYADTVLITLYLLPHELALLEQRMPSARPGTALEIGVLEALTIAREEHELKLS